MAYYIFLALFAALLVWIVDASRGERDGHWHGYVGWFSVRRQMRRRVRGAWQYREMTAEEAMDAIRE